MSLPSRLSPLLLALACGASTAFAIPATKPAQPMVVPFIDDDYARAVAEARARKVPIFVEAWAPW